MELLQKLSNFEVKRVFPSIPIGLVELIVIVRILSLSGLQVPATVYRVTYINPFESVVFFSHLADSLAVLVCFAFSVFLFHENKRLLYISIASVVLLFFFLFTNGTTMMTDAVIFGTAIAFAPIIIFRKRNIVPRYAPVSGLLVVLSAVAFFSLLTWIIYAAIGGMIFEGELWHIARLQLLMNGALAWLAPAISLMMVNFFLIRPYIRSAFRFIKKRLVSESTQDKNVSDIYFLVRYRTWFLPTIMAFSVYLAMTPYLPSINPETSPMGTDLSYYVGWLTEMDKLSEPAEILNYAFFTANDGDRGIPIILLYALVKIGTPITLATIIFIPLVSPILVFIVYQVTRRLSNSQDLSLLAAFFTATSHHLIVGTYGGFIANYLALVPMYLTIFFATELWKKPNKKNLVLSLAFASLTLFSHVYTFTFLVAALAGFVVFSIVVSRGIKSNQKAILYFVILIGLSLFLDISKTYLLSSAGGIEKDLTLPENYTGIDQYVLRWNNLIYSFTTFHGGLFAFTIGLILVLIWMIGANYHDPFERMLLSTIFVGSLPFILGNYTIQSRMLYNMPLQIAIGLAIISLLKSDFIQRRLSIIVVVFVILVSIEYSIRATSNLFLRLP